MKDTFNVTVYYVNGDRLYLENVTCICSYPEEVQFSIWVNMYEIAHKKIDRTLVKQITIGVKGNGQSV